MKSAPGLKLSTVMTCASVAQMIDRMKSSVQIDFMIVDFTSLYLTVAGYLDKVTLATLFSHKIISIPSLLPFFFFYSQVQYAPYLALSD